jgi:hypothetical protein
MYTVVISKNGQIREYPFVGVVGEASIGSALTYIQYLKEGRVHSVLNNFNVGLYITGNDQSRDEALRAVQNPPTIASALRQAFGGGNG